MKKIWEMSGVNLYEKWILPSNSESKNPIWKKINKILRNNSSLSSNGGLKGRIKDAYLVGGAHIYLFIVLFWLPSNYMDEYTFWAIQIFGNIYPILVQVKTGIRINKILSNKRH